MYNVFGFKYHVELSTRPEDSMGTEEQWDMAISSLRSLRRKRNRICNK